MSPKTLVTGATGFLGKHVCEALLQRGENVVALGRNFSRFDLRNCQTLSADLADEVALQRACEKVDTVIHSGALSAPWGEREAFLRTNVRGTENLLRAATQAGVRRFVYVSSSSVVFDNQDRVGVTEALPMPKTFLSYYTESKAMAEERVRSWKAIETVILRPRGIFGPGDTSLLPRLLRLAKNRKLRIIGDGQNRQDLTYVDNVVHALLLAREGKEAVGRTFFITNDEPVSLWDYLSNCLEGLGHSAPTRHVPLSLAYEAARAMEAIHRALPRLGEPKLTRYTVSLLGRTQTFDISAAKTHLHYQPKVSMSEALNRTVEWFRKRLVYDAS